MNRAPVTVGQLIYAFLFPVFMAAVFFWLAGDWTWIEGWIWTAWFLALCWFTTLYLYFRDPELLKERFQPLKTTNQVKAQAYLIYVLAIAYLVWFVIQPLDAKRFGWTSPFSLSVEALGGGMLAVSYFFIFRAFADNTYASPLIRVQKERNQVVVSTGVYAIIRHPMYLGAVLMIFGKPLLLGSAYGLWTGGLFVALLIPRILGEERMLVNELAGYGDYQQKVRYRLVPGVW